jgi:hypothetical protein
MRLSPPNNGYPAYFVLPTCGRPAVSPDWHSPSFPPGLATQYFFLLKNFQDPYLFSCIGVFYYFNAASKLLILSIRTKKMKLLGGYLTRYNLSEEDWLKIFARGEKRLLGLPGLRVYTVDGL